MATKWKFMTTSLLILTQIVCITRCDRFGSAAQTLQFSRSIHGNSFDVRTQVITVPKELQSPGKGAFRRVRRQLTPTVNPTDQIATVVSVESATDKSAYLS